MLGWRTMRMICSSRFCHASLVNGHVHRVGRGSWAAHLEALVLEDALDGGVLAAGRELGLENDSERTIANNLALRVGQVLVLAGQAVLDLLPDDLWGDVSVDADNIRSWPGIASLPPMRRLEKADGRFCDIAWGAQPAAGVRMGELLSREGRTSGEETAGGSRRLGDEVRRGQRVLSWAGRKRCGVAGGERRCGVGAAARAAEEEGGWWWACCPSIGDAGCG